MRIGILAIQGDYAAHARSLRRLGVDSQEVRRVAELGAVDGLIIPGGESTTMLKFLDEEGLTDAIRTFSGSGKPILGTCAGAIVLAREVTNPEQESLRLIDITVERNSYGRQVDSFIEEAETTLPGGKLEAVFIRAPKIVRVGDDLEVLATLRSEPIMVRQGNLLAATFHPELTGDDRIHRVVVDMAERGEHRFAK